MPAMSVINYKKYNLQNAFVLNFINISDRLKY